MSSFRLLRLVFAFLYRQNRIGNSAAQTNIYRLLAKSRKIARLARECWQQLQTHPSVCLFGRTQNIFFRVYIQTFVWSNWVTLMNAGRQWFVDNRNIKDQFLILQNFDASNQLMFSTLVYFSVHMGQFLRGGKNGHLMSFFLKVEPPCDQT